MKKVILAALFCLSALQSEAQQIYSFPGNGSGSGAVLGTQTFTGQQNFSANASLVSGGYLLMNGSSDTNWLFGLATGKFTTQLVGATTSIQIVTGTGTPGPDGFAIGATGGASYFECEGHNSECFFSGPVSIGVAGATISPSEVALAKISASGTAPGAGALKFEAVAGTNSGSCKIIAYAGTSSTAVTVVDNVGSGC